jgi:glycosyltransferase involved in cell wall biosynthesis
MLEHFLRPLSAPPLFADLCHAASNGLGVLLAMTAKWEWGTPFLLTEHGLYLRERYIAYGPTSMSHHQRAFMLGFFRNMVAAAYHAADVVAPGSEYNRAWEVETGANASSVQPIYNGIHAASFQSSDWEPDVPTIAWVGRIDPLKDVKTLLRAVAQVREQIPDVRLRIFGGTPRGNEAYHRECVALRDSLDLSECATFEGRVPSISAAYHAGHVVVSTSISEGFPYSVLEAMACGRAMVATDVGGVREAVGPSGVMVAPHDHVGIARACVELLTDHARRRSLAEQGRERVRERFTLDLCLARYQSIYVNLSDVSYQDDPTTSFAFAVRGGAA